MAMNEVIFVLFVCFLGSARATYCSSNYKCGSGECCDSYGKCSDCSISASAIVGIVFGILVLISIVGSIVSCWICACCPYYHYRHHPGTVIVSATPAYQPSGFVCTLQQTIQQPPPMGYNPAQPPPYYPQPQGGPYPPPQTNQQPPAMGYNPAQPPQYYPQPQPPPQAQGPAPYPPPQA